MADITIKKTDKEILFEAKGIQTLDLKLLKSLFGLDDSSSHPEIVDYSTDDDYGCGQVHNENRITPGMLKDARRAGTLDKLLHLNDEIEVTTRDSSTIKFACAHLEPTSARFVSKYIRYNLRMNPDNVNSGGYFSSACRKFILDRLYPKIDLEWRQLFTIHEISERPNVDNHYYDVLYVLSKQDVFGPPDIRLDLFNNNSNLVRTTKDGTALPWWLRDYCAYDGGSDSGAYFSFLNVSSDGELKSSGAYELRGLVLGVDI